MSAGRKSMAPADVQDVVLDQDKVAQAHQQMVVDAKLQSQVDMREVFELGQQVGAIQMTRMTTAALSAGGLKLFAEVQKSNVFKHIAVKHPDGSVRPADSIREFTRIVFGASYSKLAEEQQNLTALGEECYQAAQQLGLGRGNLRLIRALPPAELERVQEALKEAKTSAEVSTLVEDLALQVVDSRAKLKEAQEESQAKDALLSTKNEQMDKLKTKLRRIPQMTRDEAAAQLRAEATQAAFAAQAAVQGNLRLALVALDEAGDAAGDRNLHQLFMGGLVGCVQAELTKLRDAFGLPDISSAADAQLAADVAAWADPKPTNA